VPVGVRVSVRVRGVPSQANPSPSPSPQAPPTCLSPHTPSASHPAERAPLIAWQAEVPIVSGA
jgi:hypothetical protein